MERSWKFTLMESWNLRELYLPPPAVEVPPLAALAAPAAPVAPVDPALVAAGGDPDDSDDDTVDSEIPST
jgi:hypothetical protein